VWTKLAKLKETLATLQTAEGEEELDSNISTVSNIKALWQEVRYGIH